MAPAVVPASPALRAAVIRCVNQPAASLAVQQAAIQVYRLTPVPKEASYSISKVCQIVNSLDYIFTLFMSLGQRIERSL